jgi:sterol desaturase/sphingolipid hydroxylase (fatty acid hydroxylase superfamily)
MVMVMHSCMGVCVCRDNFLILQLLLAAMALYAFPSLRHLPLWDARGVAVALLLHVAATEPLFYLLHRALHRGRLFFDYHSLHHSSRVLQPYTGKTI